MSTPPGDQPPGVGGPPPFGPPGTPPPPPPFPFICSNQPNQSCLLPPNFATITSLITTSSVTTILTSTITSNFISTTTAISVSITPVVFQSTPTISAALETNAELLKDGIGVSKTNLRSTIAIGVTTIVLILLLFLLILFLYLRQRHQAKKQQQKLDPESQSQELQTPHQPPKRPERPEPLYFPPGTAPQIITEENLSSQFAPPNVIPPPINTTMGAQALTSHPPTPRTRSRRRKRASSAPASAFRRVERAPRIETIRGLPLPRIRIWDGDMRSSPSSGPDMSGIYPEESPPVSPMSQNSPRDVVGPLGGRDVDENRRRRMAMYHEALREEAELERGKVEREEAQRRGLPVIEREASGELGEGEGGERESLDEVESELGGLGGWRNESRQQDVRGQVLHSTRASSGIFPEGEREGEEWSNGSAGSNGSVVGVVGDASGSGLRNEQGENVGRGRNGRGEEGGRVVE